MSEKEPEANAGGFDPKGNPFAENPDEGGAPPAPGPEPAPEPERASPEPEATPRGTKDVTSLKGFLDNEGEAEQPSEEWTAFLETLPEDMVKDGKLLGKFNNVPDAMNSYREMEKKFSRGETGKGPAKAEDYYSEANFKADAFAEEHSLEPDMVNPSDSGWKALAAASHDLGLSVSDQHKFLGSFYKSLRDQGLLLTSEQKTERFSEGLKEHLGVNYEEVAKDVATFAYRTLAPDLTEASRNTLDEMMNEPRAILLMKEMMDRAEGRKSAVVKPSEGEDERKTDPRIPSTTEEIEKALDSPEAEWDKEYRENLTNAWEAAHKRESRRKSR